MMPSRASRSCACGSWGGSGARFVAKAWTASLACCLVLPFDDALSQHRVEVTAHRARSVRTIECGDARIAATAVQYALPLVAHNAAEYEDILDLHVTC